MRDEIESRITLLVASTLHVDQATIGRHTTFAGDLAADSLDLVALILAVEDEFQVDIHDEEAAEILTIGEMIQYVAFALADKESTVATRSKGAAELHLR